MSAERPAVPCPTCGRNHPGHRRAQPHYCSIAYYRAGHGLDDPLTGDGRHYCPRCRHYHQAGQPPCSPPSTQPQGGDC